MTSGNFKIIKDKKKRKISKKPIIITIAVVLLIAASVAAYLLYADWRDRKDDSRKVQGDIVALKETEINEDNSTEYIENNDEKCRQYKEFLKDAEPSKWNDSHVSRAIFCLIYFNSRDDSGEAFILASNIKLAKDSGINVFKSEYISESEFDEIYNSIINRMY